MVESDYQHKRTPAPTPDNPTPLAAKAYLAVVIAAGLGVLLYCLMEAFRAGAYQWLYLATLVGFASFFPIRIPVSRSNNNAVACALGDILVFTGILLFGPAIAACLAAVEAVAVSFKMGVKVFPKGLFNVAHLTLTGFFVGVFFNFIHGVPAPLNHSQIDNPAMLLIEVGACGLVYFLLDLGMLSAGVALSTRVSFLSVWNNVKFSAIAQCASAFLGALTFLYFGASEFYYVILAAPMVLLVYYTFKVNQSRVNQAHKHLEEVQALLAEKILAERELQKAKDSLETRVQQRTHDLREANQRLRVEVNDRKAAQRALAAETERLRVTLRSIADGVVTTDIEGRVVLLNEVAERLTGWTLEDAEGKPLDEVFKIIHLGDRTPSENLCQRVLSSGEIMSLDGQDRAIVAKDGAERMISHSAAPIRENHGEVTGVVMVFRDITEEQRLERELLKAQKLESLGILAGGIAHDFNNILSGILLKTQLAQRALGKGRDPLKHLQAVQEAVQTATALTQQLLTFAKGGAPVKQAASVSELLTESASFALRGSQIRCEMKIAPDLWTAEIDRGQISQVVHNLVINAAQAMPGGGTIRIEASNLELHGEKTVGDMPPGIYIQIAVADEGCGIRPEVLTSIFDPYFSTKPTGHGLGLTTTHSIIKRHGGHITVESELGAGSRFTFYLPASKVVVQAKPKPDQPAPVEVGEILGRVLVMDDEPHIRESLGEVLEELGYSAGFSADGAQALRAYREAMESGHPYDVVIMDLTIPGGMGGREAIGQLLELDPEAQAIVYSGYSRDPVMAAYRDHGFRAMLPKPFKFQQLGSLLTELIPKRNGFPRSNGGAGAGSVAAEKMVAEAGL